MRSGYTLAFVSIVGLFLNGGCGSTSQAHKPAEEQLPIVTQDEPAVPPTSSMPTAPPVATTPDGNGLPSSTKSPN